VTVRAARPRRAEVRLDPASSGTLRLVRPSGEQPPAHAALAQLERLLASRDFDGTPRSRAFLRFIVEETLAGRQAGLSQTALAIHVFGRRQDFDPTIDPSVRIQAGRLRRSLERYYLLAGTGDAVRIDLPRGGYVPVVRWAATRTGAASASPTRGLARRADDWPSVVVGPFRAAGADWRTDETALRFSERLAFELGRYGDVRVVLRSELERSPVTPAEGGRFTLSGYLSGPDHNELRVVARLVDGASARQIWADELSGGVGAAASDEEAARLVASRIASEHGVIARTLWAERRERPSAEASTYEAVLRSYHFFLSRQPSDLAAALAALQSAVAAEPQFGLAWAQLARLYAENHASEVTAIDTPIDLAVSAAYEGTRVDPFGQRARAALAQALLVKGDLAGATTEALRALELEPRSFANLDVLGWLLTLAGDGDRGLALVREAMARNPNHSPVVFQALWASHLRRGEIEKARGAAQQYRDPASFWPGVMQACSLGHLGKLKEGRAESAQLLERRPDFARRGRALVGRLIKLPELRESVFAGLRKAGLGLD
jgi:adenylate cyclase